MNVFVICVCVCDVVTCMCVGLRFPVCMCKPDNDGCRILSLPCFSETESLNLDLDWWPENPRDPRVSTLHSSGDTGACGQIWNFCMSQGFEPKPPGLHVYTASAITH